MATTAGDVTSVTAVASGAVNSGDAKVKATVAVETSAEHHEYKVALFNAEDAVVGSWATVSGESGASFVHEFSIAAAGKYTVKAFETINQAEGTAVESAEVTVAAATKDQIDAANRAWANAQITVNAEEDEDGEYNFAYTGSPVDFKVLTVIDDVTGETLGLDDYAVYYDGDPATTTAPTAVGQHKMTVVPAGDLVAAGATYQYCTQGQTFTFNIAQSSLSEARLYQVDENAADNGRSDTSFTYTGADLFAGGAYGVVLDGQDITDQVKVSVRTGSTPVVSGATAAGTYNVRIEGESGAYDGLVFAYNLEVAKFDLSTATVVINDMSTNAGPTAAEITVKNGNDVLGAGAFAGATWNNGTATATGNFAMAIENLAPAKGGTTSGAVTRFNELGTYTISFEALETSTNVVGSATGTMNRVSKTATFKYDGKEFADQAFDNSLGTAFDPEKIAVKDGDKTLDADQYTVTVTKDGQEVTSYTEPGTYTVVVQVNVAQGGKYELGGKDTFDFTVTNGTATVNATSMSIGTELVWPNGSFSADYNGEPFAVKATIKLMDGDKVVKTLVEGADYTFEIKKGNDAVDEIKDAGDYTVEVKSDSYDVSAISGKVSFKVNQLAATGVTVKESEIKDYTADPSDEKTTIGILATGEAISPTVQFASGDKTIAIPSENYTVTYKKYTDPENDITVNDTGTWTPEDNADLETIPAEQVKDAGFYVMEIKPAAEGNFSSFDPGTLRFRVVDTVAFADVPASAWYADEVAKAFSNGYVNGVAAGIFAPEQNMTRAEFAKVVANMAGYGYSLEATYPTQFSDVPADAWFAGAVEWAARYGIINGTSATTFDPYGTITREEIATMLYRYAGNGAQADASALDAFVDGAQVSDWAENAMAWAVEEGYMNGKGANDLQPQATATRAEIAALAVRVQPKAL